MSERYRTTRRAYLKATTAAGVAGFVGLSASASARQGGAIQMGSILPITGDLSAYGSGMQEAANLAVQDVNDAGGPLDRQVNVTNTDSQTQPSQAIQEYNSLVNEQGIVGFVGAASSGVSVPLAENVAADQVKQVSNASTTPAGPHPTTPSRASSWVAS
jgi:ABC-type branched-subunit amino acid transport system substrate-binding protein